MKQIADNFINAFKNFDPLFDTLDIVLVAVCIYSVFAFLKRINSAGFIKYMIGGAAIIALAFALRERFTIFYPFALAVAASAVVLFVTVYLSDVRRLVWSASAPKALRPNYSTNYGCSDAELNQASSEIIRAVLNMAKSNTGALIVLAQKEMPMQILESGTKLDALVSAPLMESIFFPNTPLHDGAVLIYGNKIVAAGCFLPLSSNLNIQKDLGTRHRAALGVSEDVNVVVIIVSEETGIISVAKNGILSRYFDSHMLRETIGLTFGLIAGDSEKHGGKRKKKTK